MVPDPIPTESASGNTTVDTWVGLVYTSSMRLKNTTDIPDETIRSLIRDITGGNIPLNEVKIWNASSGGSGRAHPWMKNIMVKVPETERKARRVWQAHGAYLTHTIGSRMEALVQILAHEIRHVWRCDHQNGKVWGSRGKYSERDADAFGIRMLRKFRRGEFEVKPVPAQLEPRPPKKPEKETKHVALRAAEALGVEVTDGEAHAPAGFVFKATGTHTLSFSKLDDLMNDLLDGLTGCGVRNCQECCSSRGGSSPFGSLI